jgi:hypothetical protein
MNRPAPTTVSAVCTALALFLAVTAMAQAAAPKAQVRITVFLKKLGIDFDYKEIATVKDIASKRYKSVIIVTGASLKGMGAAGVEMKDELARTAALIGEARKLGVVVIGAHVEGMARRAQGASPGDNSDEQSIDAVCPNAQILLVRKDGDEDGRFTTISKTKKIPLLLFEKSLDISDVLKNLFSK